MVSAVLLIGHLWSPHNYLNHLNPCQILYLHLEPLSGLIHFPAGPRRTKGSSGTSGSDLEGSQNGEGQIGCSHLVVAHCQRQARC